MIDWPEAARQGALLAGGVNGGLLVTLLLTQRWWRHPRAVTGATSAEPATAGESAVADHAPDSGRWSPRAFWITLIVILMVAAGLRAPLAGSSLWWDEVWQARHASVGDWRPDRKNPGQLRFRETTWPQALWNYRKPTNHPPMSVASKVCHETWRKLTGAPPGAFREWVLRLPGMVASLAGIAMAALLLRAWGTAGGGLAAAIFLTVHPWHIRYGIDGRGYTFLVPLTLLGLWALWRACGPARLASDGGSTAAAASPSEAVGGLAVARSPASTWWAWWVFGFTQAFILWSHLLSVWVCLALCATGVWWIWRHATGSDRWRALARLAVVQVAGAMLFFQLFLPNLLQALNWGEKNQDGRLLDAAGVIETLMDAAVGRPSPVWALAVGGTAVSGLVLARRAHLPGFGGLVALVLAAVGCFAAIAATQFFFYPRFLFAIIVPVALAIGIFFGRLPQVTRKWMPALPAWAHRWVSLGCLTVMAAALAPGLPPALTRSFSPLRETAAHLRDGQAAGAEIFGYGFGAEALQYYLPTLPYARESDAPDQLAAAMESARAAGRPLLVATGYEALNRLAIPRGFDRLDDPSFFTVTSNHAGLESEFAYRIRRFNPPSPAR